MTVEEIIAEATKDIPTTILAMWDRPGSPPGNGWRETTSVEKAAAFLAALDVAGYAVVPKAATPQMVAAAVPNLEPDIEDYDAAIQAIQFLPETDHPDIADVLAQISADYRVMIEARPK